MDPALEDKLAAILWHMTEVRADRRAADRRGLESYLDDPQVASWLTGMNKAGRIKNTRFIGK